MIQLNPLACHGTAHVYTSQLTTGCLALSTSCHYADAPSFRFCILILFDRVLH